MTATPREKGQIGFVEGRVSGVGQHSTELQHPELGIAHDGIGFAPGQQ